MRIPARSPELIEVPILRLVFPGAVATPARESEKISAAIRMEKNEAVLVDWLKHIKTLLLYLRHSTSRRAFYY
jgi:hypothetical protein